MKKKKDSKSIENAGLTGAAAEVVQRYGSANKEFLIGYSGYDNETSLPNLKKSLDSISKSRINSDYEYNNIHQQSGYSAEVAKVSNDNANNIINNSNKRTIRTDDHPNYKTNDTVIDHIEVINGNEIPGTGSQMKFVNDPKELIDHIATGDGCGKSDLSRYLDVTLDLPSDQVDDKLYKKYCIKEVTRLRKLAEQHQKDGENKIAERLIKKAKRIEDGKNIGLKEYCDIKAKELQQKSELHQKMGKKELAAKERQQAKNYIKVRDKIRNSKISTKEAIFYRKHPKLATLKDIGKTSHRAGMEQAKWGAAISGTISLTSNLVAVIKNEKSPKNAAIDVIKNTGSGTILSYVTAYTGATIKALMQNASSGAIRTLSKTNLPGLLVTTTIEAGKTLRRYLEGEIDGVGCLNELGEKGTGLLSSAMFSTLGVAGSVSLIGKSVIIGQLAIPIPVFGGLVGGMVGYALNSACYGILVNALNEAKLAREERIIIEAECKKAILLIRKNRIELELLISKYLTDHITTFKSAFVGIKTSLKEDNIDGFIDSMSIIPVYLGKKVQFKNFKEFIGTMNSNDSFIL